MNSSFTPYDDLWLKRKKSSLDRDVLCFFTGIIVGIFMDILVYKLLKALDPGIFDERYRLHPSSKCPKWLLALVYVSQVSLTMYVGTRYCITHGMFAGQFTTYRAYMRLLFEDLKF